MAISERAETAILVRRGMHIAGRHTLRMRLPWRGPKAGLAHDPREYKWVGIQHGVRWKVLITHLPFGAKQQRESLRRIKRWFGNHRGPTIAGGDWNTSAAMARTGTGERVTGYGIDLTAYKRCRIVRKLRLGKHGSDHHAVLVEYVHHDKAGKDHRLTVIWWNVRVGHKPEDVRKAIDGWTERYHPDVIGLSEAYGMRGHLSGLGYQVTQVVGAKKAKKAAKPKKPAKPIIPVMGRKALAAAETQSRKGPTFAYGMCLQRVRICFGIGPSASDAIGAWNAAQHKHRTTDAKSIPAGYPVFWSGGSRSHGHIAISAGKGKCWSTDLRRRGYFDLVPIDAIHQQWGLTLLGWTSDLNGRQIS